MKKLIYTLIALVILALVLSFAACGAAKLPGGMTEDGIKAAAEKTVEQLNAQDYDTLLSTMDQTMQDALPGNALKQAWQPFYDEAGAFDSITKTTVTAKNGYGVAVVSAKYANKTVTFTLSYNTDMTLGGLFFK